MYEGEWIRHSPTEHALFLHKGQSRKQSNVSASNKKQFHGDLRAVCQTCGLTSRGQAWTLMWRASLCICPITSCVCRPDPRPSPPAPGRGWRTSTEQLEEKRGDLWVGLGLGETRSNRQAAAEPRWAGADWGVYAHSGGFAVAPGDWGRPATRPGVCFRTVALKWYAVLELQNVKICYSSKL